MTIRGGALGGGLVLSLLFSVEALVAQGSPADYSCDPIPPCFTDGDPPQTFCRRPVAHFRWDWFTPIVEEEIGGFIVYWQRPGDLGWAEVEDMPWLWCGYKLLWDGSEVWVCPMLELGLPALRHLDILPGTQYRLAVKAFKYNHTLGDWVTSTSFTIAQDIQVGTDIFCQPEYWWCNETGCSAILADTP